MSSTLDSALGLDGKMHPKEELLVWRVLSFFVGELRGDRQMTHRLCQILAAIANAETDAEGNERTFRAPRYALRSRELSNTDLSNLWTKAKRKDGLLDRDLLEELVPLDLWWTVASSIHLGPIGLAAEIEDLVALWAQGLRSDGEERARGALGRSSLEGRITAAWKLMRSICLVNERSERYGFERLTQWERTRLPDRPKLDTLEIHVPDRDRSAPPLIMVRKALRDLDAAVEKRKRLKRRGPRYRRLLRDRALVGVFAAVGARVGAVYEMNLSSYIREHTFKDGSVGPALVIRGMRGKQQKRIKGIPELLAYWIEEYIDFSKMTDPDEPLWRPSRKDLLHQRFSEVGLHGIVVRALRPYSPEHDYSPHTLRHLAEKVGYLAGLDWLNANRERLLTDDGGMPASAQVFSDILLDHALNDISDRYKDLLNERNRELWARETALGIWEYLWGDRGARWGHDLELIDEAKREFEMRQAEETEIDERIQALVARARSADALPHDEVLRLMLAVVTDAQSLARAGVAAERARVALEAALETKVPIPDDVVELPDTPDIAVLTGDAHTEPPICRDWVTPEEFRWAVGFEVLKKSTLRRYMAGTLPFPAGDRRNLWDPPAQGKTSPDPVESTSTGGRKRRIRVDKLDRSRYHPDVLARLDALRRESTARTFSGE